MAFCCRVYNWATFSLLKTNSAGKWEIQKNEVSKKNNQKFCVDNWAIWANMWPSYRPYRGSVTDPTYCTEKAQNNSGQNRPKPLFLQCFRKKSTHTNIRKQKNKNTIIFTFGNITAPLDFDRKLFRFCPPLLMFSLPLAYLTTEQHKNKTITSKKQNNNKQQ